MNRNGDWKLSTDPTRPPQRGGVRTKKLFVEQKSPLLGDLGGQGKYKNEWNRVKRPHPASPKGRSKNEETFCGAAKVPLLGDLGGQGELG
jgi:hypothetical protein